MCSARHYSGKWGVPILGFKGRAISSAAAGVKPQVLRNAPQECLRISDRKGGPIDRLQRRAVHAHPTLSEAIHESVFDAWGKALNH